MTGIREIRKKMVSIESTKKITSAMEKVAASKMRKSQVRMGKARPYADAVTQITHYVADANLQYTPKLMEVREVRNVGFIVISTDKGLCGGLNLNLFKAVAGKAATLQSKEIGIEVCPMGVKGHQFFRSRANVKHFVSPLGDNPSAEPAIAAIQLFVEKFVNGEIDELYCCSNSFVNSMVQEPTIRKLFPVVAEDMQADMKTADKSSKDKQIWDFLYEPDPQFLLDMLLQRYVESVVYRAIVENFACEQAAKMIAMKNASENAGELIDKLRLQYNNARQAAITKEISEIIGGAEAV